MPSSVKIGFNRITLIVGITRGQEKLIEEIISEEKLVPEM